MPSQAHHGDVSLVCLKAPWRTSVPGHLEQVLYVWSDTGAVQENKTRADNVL